jgi:periplasmic protein CpxP/Spy
MNSPRFMKVAIAVLAALNIITLSYMWFRDQRPFPPKGHDAGLMLTKELGLTEKQRSQFEEMKERHHEKVDSLRSLDRRLHKSYFDMLEKVPLDTYRIDAMSKEMGAIRAEIERTTFFHFAEVRAICDPAQQKKFDNIIQDVLKQMHHGPRPGPPPHKNE